MSRRPTSRSAALVAALGGALAACTPAPAARAGGGCAELPFLSRYEALGTVTRWPGAVQLRLTVDQRSEDGPSPCATTELRLTFDLADDGARCRIERARVSSFENVGCAGPSSPPGMRRVEAFRLARPVDLADPDLDRIDLDQRRRALVLLRERFWWYEQLEPGQRPVLRLRARGDPPTACCLGATSSAFAR